MLNYDQIYQNPEIKITNYDDDLIVFNYRFVNQNTPEYIKHCKGAIFTKNTQELVVQTQPFVEELTLDDIELEDFEAFEAFEGTAIRVFFYNKWYFSTYKRLDAKSSYWGTKDTESFGDIFESRILGMFDTVQNFLDTLDKTRVYVFLLRPSESTRLVSSAKDDIMLYEVYKLHSSERLSETVEGFNSPKRLNFENKDVMQSYIENLDWKEQCGIILKNDNRTIRILNSKYENLLKLRDASIQDVGIRYLLLDDDGKSDLCKLFPNFDFTKYEQAFNKAVTSLYNVAVRRKNEYVRVTSTENTVLKYYQGELSIDGIQRTLLSHHKHILQKIIHLHI